MQKASTTQLTSPSIGDVTAFDIKLLVVDIDGTIAGESNTLFFLNPLNTTGYLVVH